MLRALLLAALLTASARAQGAERYLVPTVGQRAVLVAGATAGLLPIVVLGPFATVTVAATTYGTSAALGLRPTVGGVALDTAVGTGVAVVVATGAVAILRRANNGTSDLSQDLGAVFVGVVAGAATTGVVHGVRLAAIRSGVDPVLMPVALAAPGGGGGPGVRLTVGL